MKRLYGFQLGFALGCAAAMAGAARADILPAQVLVVYNSQSTDAVVVKDAYLLAHPGIPSTNVFDLNDPFIADMADVSYSDFVSKIRDPIRSFLAAGGSPDASDIVSIVLIRGIPHRIQDTDIATAGDVPNTLLTEFSSGDATCASVDADLVLLWQNLDGGEAGGAMDSKSDNLIDNPYHQSSADIQSFSRSNIQVQKSFYNIGNANRAWGLTGNAKFKLTGGDMYLVCRIDGATANDAIASISRAQGIVVNQLHSRIVLDEDTQHLDDEGLFTPSVFNAGADYENTRDALQATGWLVDYDDTGFFITDTDQLGPVICYASYGDNHQPVPPTGTSTYIEGFLFTPGAIFNTLESYNGRALNGLGTLFGQEQIVDFVANGGTFAVGNVWEPLAFSLPDNEFLFVNFLTNGMTWAESAYSAIPGLSWMQIVVGDPLARVDLVVDQPADFDGDGDVDENDFHLLETCYSGADITQGAPNCTNMDLDSDGDVDRADYGGLQRCFSGTNILGNPDCLP
jgi:uncharacterized protein (TIGR03790 family)